MIVLGELYSAQWKGGKVMMESVVLCSHHVETISSNDY